VEREGQASAKPAKSTRSPKAPLPWVFRLFTPLPLAAGFGRCAPTAFPPGWINLVVIWWVYIMVVQRDGPGFREHGRLQRSDDERQRLDPCTDRRDREAARELAVALFDAVSASEMREKAVSLLLWAGADPHLRVPSLRWASLEEDEES
jgi:hypothetical protein